MRAAFVLSMVSAATGSTHINVFHVLETTINASQNPGDDAPSAEECSVMLQSVEDTLPTAPAELAEFASAQTEAPSSDASCTRYLPLSISEPLVSVLSSIVGWSADNAQVIADLGKDCRKVPGSDAVWNHNDWLHTVGCYAEDYTMMFTEGKMSTAIGLWGLIESLVDEQRHGPASEPELNSQSTTATATSTSPSTGTSSPAMTESHTAAQSSDGAAAMGLSGVAAAAVAGVAGVMVAL